MIFLLLYEVILGKRLEKHWRPAVFTDSSFGMEKAHMQVSKTLQVLSFEKCLDFIYNKLN